MANVLVGMSGGIDSAVSAYLLKRQGHNVTGITMTTWKDDLGLSANVHKEACFAPDSEEKIREIRELCEKIGIPHVVLDLSDRFKKIVLKNFKDEYLSGRTPNPCVWCNQKIKFGAMIEEARKAGILFDYFATGHYARIVRREMPSGIRYAVRKAADERKDQSYFLYRLSQERLKEVLFPLGELTKTEVRKIDVSLGLHSEDQTESQDFYGGDYNDLIGAEPKEGNIVDTEGNVLGHHTGFWNFTVGQRKGLGIAAKEALYVISLNAKKNEVVVGFKDKTFNSAVYANDIVWSGMSGPSDLGSGVKAFAKIRSAGSAAECVVSAVRGSEDEETLERAEFERTASAGFSEKDLIKVTFTDPVYSATTGQSVVIYNADGDVLCGGIICGVR